MVRSSLTSSSVTKGTWSSGSAIEVVLKPGPELRVGTCRRLRMTRRCVRSTNGGHSLTVAVYCTFLGEHAVSQSDFDSLLGYVQHATVSVFAEVARRADDGAEQLIPWREVERRVFGPR